MDTSREVGAASPGLALPAGGADPQQAVSGASGDSRPAEQQKSSPLEQAGWLQLPSGSGNADSGHHRPHEYLPEEMSAAPAAHNAAAAAAEPEPRQPPSTGLSQHPEMLVAGAQPVADETEAAPAAQPQAEPATRPVDAGKPVAGDAGAQTALPESAQQMQLVHPSGAPAIGAEAHAVQQSVAAVGPATEPLQQAQPDQHDDRAAAGAPTAVPQPQEGTEQAREGAQMQSAGSAGAQAGTSAPAAPKSATVTSSAP